MKGISIRAVMWVLDRIGVNSIYVHIERKNGPNLFYTVGWL